jgi:hypothetical protein
VAPNDCHHHMLATPFIAHVTRSFAASGSVPPVPTYLLKTFSQALRGHSRSSHGVCGLPIRACSWGCLVIPILRYHHEEPAPFLTEPARAYSLAASSSSTATRAWHGIGNRGVFSIPEVNKAVPRSYGVGIQGGWTGAMSLSQETSEAPYLSILRMTRRG